MKTMLQKWPKLYDITYEHKYLFLKCPKCNEIPYININENHSENININCDKCKYSSEIKLYNYMKNLKNVDLLKNKRCLTHNNYLNKYCYRCHIQFCSKCEISNQHSSHEIKIIKKIFTPEKIDKAKKILESYKNYFNTYIFDFMDKHLNKFQKSRHYYIINNLIKKYIEEMKIFFHFYDCLLLNYDIENPNYYQQINLHNFILRLRDKPYLLNLNEQKLERIFKYFNNNFLVPKIKYSNDLIINDKINFTSEIKNAHLLIKN